MSFDRVAPFYGPMEHLLAGRCMQQARMWPMEEETVSPPREVLMVGEGHGRFLREFRGKFPQARITIVDASAKMLEIARQGFGRDERMTFVNSRLEDWKTGQRFDLIVTNFLLDCFPAAAMEDAVSHLGSLATPDARWWIAEFNLPEQGIARWRARWILRLLYLFFGIVAGVKGRELHPPDIALKNTGFQRTGRKEWSWGLLKSERWHRVLGSRNAPGSGEE